MRDGDVTGLNRRKGSQTTALTEGDFRPLDLRSLDAAGGDFSNSYFRGADLRGIDSSKAPCERARLNAGLISGVPFPAALAAEEMELSLKPGARLPDRTARAEAHGRSRD